MSALPRGLLAALARITVEEAPGGIAASLVVEPRSAEDLVEVVRAATEHGVSISPLGRGSTLQKPGPGIVVVTSGLSGIVDYQPDDLTVVVGAGMTLEDLDGVLADRDLSAVLPETSPQRTVGGVVATGTSGYRRLGYGPTRDRVLEVTMVTGYGEIVRAGGRLVKNVTGYDLSRLATGSLGSLGVIVSVCFKLWPVAQPRRTVTVGDAASALLDTYRPVAVLETDSESLVYVQGDPVTIDQQVDALGGDAVDGFTWPESPDAPVRMSVNVPPRSLVEAVNEIRKVGVNWFVAQHGVGVLDIGVDVFDEGTVGNLRSWAESRGGSLVVSAPGLTSTQRWGGDPDTIDIQRRMKDLFDPEGICNPGVLPGGV